MQDISVAELLMEILDDEKKARILSCISNDLHREELLDRLLDFPKGE